MIDSGDPDRPEGSAPLSRSSQVATQLREAIVAGDLAPGERLREAHLAEQYGVSRIPVREALRALESEGFVTIAPNRGAVVNHVDPSEAADLIEVRQAIEALIVRRAASRCTHEDATALRETITAARDAIREKRWADLPHLNTAFHDGVASVAGNVIARRVAGQLREKIEWAYAANSEARAERSWADHEALVDALEARDTARATRIIRRHVDETGDAHRRPAHFEAMQAAARRR